MMDNTKEEYQHYLDLNNLDMGLEPVQDPNDQNDIIPLCERLCDCYVAMKSDQPVQNRIYRPNGEWKIFHDNRKDIYEDWYSRNHIATYDSLSNFWRNDLGSIVKQYAMYTQLLKNEEIRERFADCMAYDYMVWENLFNTDPKELEVPPIGSPWGYVINDITIAPKALRYHAIRTQIIDLTSDIKRPTVSEIGAGYCGLAFFLIRDIPSITYIDFDLPETLIIGAYYLLRSFPEKKVLLYGEGEFDGKSLTDYDIILMPNWIIDKLPDESVNIFVNTFSLSEMPFQVISEYVEHITRCCNGYFFHNNMDRKGVIQYGYQRTPASDFPIDRTLFKLLYKRYDLFQRRHFGKDGDYREYLYEKINR